MKKSAVRHLQRRKRYLFRTQGNALRLTDSACRTHQTAQMAANTAGANKVRTTRFAIEDDGLVTTIVARHLTTTTAYAQLMIELRIDNGFAIERIGLQEQRQRLANK